MTVFAADDAGYIAQRMREIEADKRTASGNIPPELVKPVPVESAQQSHKDGWVAANPDDEFLYACY